MLISNYLHYTALWDIDLLFRSEREMSEFLKKTKTDGLRIINYDDELTINENIASFHAAWTFDKNWFNVDYILKTDLFEFFAGDPAHTAPYHHVATWQDMNFKIHLFQAHPWDIIVSKVVSPRAVRDIALRVDMSIDIRHVFATYQVEKDNRDFWQHITARARDLCEVSVFKRRFLELLEAAPELGYQDIEISPTAMQMLGES